MRGGDRLAAAARDLDYSVIDAWLFTSPRRGRARKSA